MRAWNKRLSSRAGRSSVSARNNRTFQRSLLQGQGAFCYVNEPNSFVLVAVFKCQVVDTSVVLNTSNRGAEHQPRASRVLLQTRRDCLGLHFKQQLLDARNGPRSPSSNRGGPLQDRGIDRAAKPRLELLPPGSLPTGPNAQTNPKLSLPPLVFKPSTAAGSQSLWSWIWKLKKGVKDVPPSALNLVLS